MNNKQDIIISVMTNKEELEVLRGMSSFNYKFDDNLINLLKKNFALKDSLYILVKKGDKFAGFCSVDRDWWEDGYFFLREILVEPTFQKLRIGSTIMKKCLDHAKNKGAVGVVTETDSNNLPMQIICTKMGFKEWDNPEWKQGITYKLIF